MFHILSVKVLASERVVCRHFRPNITICILQGFLLLKRRKNFVYIQEWTVPNYLTGRQINGKMTVEL